MTPNEEQRSRRPTNCSPAGRLRCAVVALARLERRDEVKYRVVIEQEEDGMFVAEVPSLPGCISQGSTRAEAVSNIHEAIEGYLESLKSHDEP